MTPRGKPPARPGVLVRIVPPSSVRQFVHRRSRVLPGASSVKLLTDEGMHNGGMAAARRLDPHGKRVVEMVTSRRKDVAHEVEHGAVIGFASDMHFPNIRTSSWLALMIEFSLPSRQKKFEQRDRVDRREIMKEVRPTGLKNARGIQTLHEHLSRLYPSAAAYRRVLLTLMKNPRLRAHLEALNAMDYGTKILYGYLHREEALDHIAPIVKHLVARATVFGRRATRVARKS